MAVTTFAGFFATDYSTIFGGGDPVDTIFQLFANPRVPIYSVVLYLALSKHVFFYVKDFLGLKPKSSGLQMLTIVHSGILALYSGWTFVNTMKIILPLMSANGFYHTLCDVDGHVWHEHGLGFWITHFYLSKYYEFIDTWIVLLKGRDPIFLQTFHHAGIVLLMWGFVVTFNTCGGLITTCFNSFIHTLMYTYYTFAACGYSSPLKHYLTQAQIIQFLVGIALTIPAHFMSGCINQAQSIVNAAIQLYAVALIALFYQFYVASYSNKKAAKKVE